VAQRHAHTQLRCLPQDAFYQSRRHADVADVDVAREGFGGKLGEADFHRGECARVVGADRVSGWLAGVAVEAAGDVDGEFFGGMGDHPIDSSVEGGARIAGGAGAE